MVGYQETVGHYQILLVRADIMQQKDDAKVQ